MGVLPKVVDNGLQTEANITELVNVRHIWHASTFIIL